MRKAEKENDMKKIRRLAALLVLLAIPLMLTGCLPGDGSYTFDAPAGFLAGIWQRMASRRFADPGALRHGHPYV